MLTCCPKCKTCFRITEQQLVIAKGLVRCGHCHKVFNGSENLTNKLPDSDPDEFSLEDPADKKEPEPSPLSASMPLNADIDLADDLDDFNTNKNQRFSPDLSSDHFDLPSFSAKDDFINTHSGLKEELSPAERGAENPKDEVEKIETSTADSILNELADDWFKADTQSKDKELSIPADAQESDQASKDKYEYSDINDGLKEEKGINDIFSDMHQQLELGIAESFGDESSTDAVTRQQHKNNTSADDDAEINQAIDSIFADSELSLYGEKEDEGDYRVEKEMLAAFGKDTHIDSSSDDIHFEDEAISLADLPHPLDGDLPSPAAKAPEPDIPRRIRDSVNITEPEKAGAWKIFASILIMFLLSTVLLGQFALFRNMEIVNRFPQTRPLLEKLCQLAPCRIHSRRDIDKIRILDRDITAHPKQKKALLITTTIVNKARFNQPYPDIQVTLSDLTGSVVAQRHFTPAEYLGSLNSPFLLMKSETPVHINISVLDPGRDAVNFEFQFL